MRTVSKLEAAPLSVPLREPFVIASGRMDTTRAVLIRATLDTGALGIGEAAALFPVTREDQPDILESFSRLMPRLLGFQVESDTLAEALVAELPDEPVLRAGVEEALLDALARANHTSVRALIGGELGEATLELTSDVTIPILPVEQMAELAVRWRARGFSAFKIKVGRDLDADLRALEAIHRRVRDVRFRIDANGGFSSREALQLASEARRMGLILECFEQPCAREDLDGMAEVTRVSGVDVVADESVKNLEDLDLVMRAKAATGVNLKLAKSGGLLKALGVGRAARRAGLTVMMGGMVETRLGMTAAAHVAAALGGVEYVDLDTAMLLAEDPFEGGYSEDGPNLSFRGLPAHGFGVRIREHSVAVTL